MVQCPSITQPIEPKHRRQEHYRVQPILEPWRRQLHIGQHRRCQQILDTMIAEQCIGNIAQQDPRTMILVEEYIDKILLVRMPGQPHRLIERIMKMIIENHLPHEGRI